MSHTLYIIVYAAMRYLPNSTMESVRGGRVDVYISEDEAVGAGIRHAREIWPVADGYMSHSALAGPVNSCFRSGGHIVTINIERDKEDTR